MPYSWITFRQARQLLAARLADTSMTFWQDAELGIYIVEALRTWNAFTEFWNTDFAFTANANSVWYDFSQYPGSPRTRTVLDTDIYTSMEYSLLEPPSGGTWTGTSQFQITDLSGALQRRRDEIIQVVGCNVQQLNAITATPNTRRQAFDDTVLEPRRARFVPGPTYGSPVTLSREDTLAFDAFEWTHLQQSKLPQAWSVITGPPLSMDVDTSPNVPGTYDVLALQSGPVFGPPASRLLDIPDDWSWLAKWGALSDLLGSESEGTDRQRADYCLKRYQDGLKVMKASNWMISATVNGTPVDTPSVREMDGWAVEWQDDPQAWPSFVQAGMDFAAVAPVPQGTTLVGVSMILIGNAPIPKLDTDKVQVSRDVMDVILDYAQVLASFKMGGSEFASTKDLEGNFFNFALETNKRLLKTGIFGDTARNIGKREDLYQPR